MTNRECRNCVFPCTGGEVLHRRGHCCRTFCPCLAFEPKSASSLIGALNEGVYIKLGGKGRGPVA